MLAVGGSTAWSEQDWSAYAHALNEQLRPFRVSGAVFITLVFADEYGPNARQRSQIAELMRGVTSKTAVLTNSTLPRYLVTAFGWLGFPMRAYSPSAFVEAAHYLELSRERQELALGAARTLGASVGGSHAAALAEEAFTRRAG